MLFDSIFVPASRWARRLVTFVYATILGATLAAQDPNILFIYLDDLGSGDMSCTNSESKILTPEIDQLAREGTLFTDAHTAAAVCGPSRYGLLTGRYPWRRGKGGMGNGAKFRDVFIEDGRLTLASLLKQKGYNTAQIGKWGLRHNYSDAVLPGKEPGNPDAYDFENRKLLGPQLFGFDYTWTLAYLDKRSSDIKLPFENSKPVDPTLTPTDPHTWLPDSAQKVIDYLKFYAGKAINPPFNLNPENPFFIYWDPTAPHAPYVPNPEFMGKTGAGVYGDFVLELDHYVGRILETLDQLNLSKDTLVILTSDNGPDKYSYDRLEDFDHYSMGERRGIKTDAFEGGHRLPLIVRWPGVVEANQRSDSLISLTDWFATFAEITGQPVPAGAGEDSLSFLSVLRDATAPSHRSRIIHHSTRGVFAIREGDWVFVDSPNPPSGEPDWFRQIRGVVAGDEPGQLFNLTNDPSQSINIYSQHPEKVRRLKQLLMQERDQG